MWFQLIITRTVLVNKKKSKWECSSPECLWAVCNQDEVTCVGGNEGVFLSLSLSLNQCCPHHFNPKKWHGDDVESTWETDWICKKASTPGNLVREFSHVFTRLWTQIQWRLTFLGWFHVESTLVDISTKCKSKLDIELTYVLNGNDCKYSVHSYLLLDMVCKWSAWVHAVCVYRVRSRSGPIWL